MFGEDAIFTLSNGEFKRADSIRVGDIILNKLRRPVKVTRVHILKNIPVVELQLNNGTNSFRINPELKAFGHFVDRKGGHSTAYKTIKEIYESEGCMKRFLNLFSPSSNIEITSYSEEPTRDVYCIHTVDTDITMIVNDVIICGNRDT